GQRARRRELLRICAYTGRDKFRDECHDAIHEFSKTLSGSNAGGKFRKAEREFGRRLISAIGKKLRGTSRMSTGRIQVSPFVALYLMSWLGEDGQMKFAGGECAEGARAASLQGTYKPLVEEACNTIYKWSEVSLRALELDAGRADTSGPSFPLTVEGVEDASPKALVTVVRRVLSRLLRGCFGTTDIPWGDIETTPAISTTLHNSSPKSPQPGRRADPRRVVRTGWHARCSGRDRDARLVSEGSRACTRRSCTSCTSRAEIPCHGWEGGGGRGGGGMKQAEERNRGGQEAARQQREEKVGARGGRGGGGVSGRRGARVSGRRGGGASAGGRGGGASAAGGEEAERQQREAEKVARGDRGGGGGGREEEEGEEAQSGAAATAGGRRGKRASRERRRTPEDAAAEREKQRKAAVGNTGRRPGWDYVAKSPIKIRAGQEAKQLSSGLRT
ncbi:hypothetical protein C8F04DRAFT_1199034, partial [Mycena alexandri]